MKTLEQWQNLEKKKLGHYLNSAWYFNKWYEKLILIGMGILSLIQIFGWIF